MTHSGLEENQEGIEIEVHYHPSSMSILVKLVLGRIGRLDHV